MGTDTGWSRAAGESSGRWRTLLDRAAGRARVPAAEPEEAPPPAAQVPQQPSPQSGQYHPASGYPSGQYPAAHPATQYSGGQYPAAAPYPAPPAPPATGGYPAPPVSPAGPGSPLPYGTAAPPTYQPPFQPVTVAQRPTQPPPAAPLGIAAPPGSPADRAVAILRRNLQTPRVIAFANPKGGVHKTTATVLAAAAIGGARGRGVVAWDDNELRGTLGLRAGSARHAKTIRHLVAELAEVELNTGPALASRIDDFLRHASDGTYDVLAGEEDPRFAWRLDPPTVRRVLDLLTRTHEVICVDTGNNVESPNWRTVVSSVDRLVVTTVPREDAAFSADWMLDHLEEGGYGNLVKNAVTLLSMPTPNPGPLLNDLQRHFSQRTRACAVVPYDPSLEPGATIPLGTSPLTIGRSGENAIALTADEYASGHHARIEPLRDGLWIVDLGSTNGTYVNGEPVAGRERLSEGDLVRVGETELRVGR